ncbi:hypothetical protein V2I01_32985 [Micromonospora sp. BRA006-A]|nr:hypothetical protein [Micromonospora sp. BRA006-A]
MPAALPPLIGAVSFQLLYSNIGIVPRGLQALLGTDKPILAFDGIAGVLVVHTFTMYTWSASAALAGMDPRSRRRRTTSARAGYGCGAPSCCRCSPRRSSRRRCWSS